MLTQAEVDEAVRESQKDGSGGRGVNGAISKALEDERKRGEVLGSAV